jgi:hypothetical protein
MADERCYHVVYSWCNFGPTAYGRYATGTCDRCGKRCAFIGFHWEEVPETQHLADQT